jgi:hypothetical protein
VWTWRGGEGKDTRPRGEVGILRDVFLSEVEPRSRIYLIMEHENTEYMGSLLFADAAFCAQVYELLSRQRGSQIAQIGDLDVSYLL